MLLVIERSTKKAPFFRVVAKDNFQMTVKTPLEEQFAWNVRHKGAIDGRAYGDR